ncbi:MAG TPA: hypothetical protein VLC11_08320 [Gemmatimonadales bacterium]|nr:hypothetical protein [Gemmatimonadales bacterium]
MATTLKNLKLDRIDFVDDGANEGARITLFKRKETPMPETTPATPAPEVNVELEKRLKDAEAANADIAKRLKDAEDAAKAAAEVIEKMRDRQERADAIEVAKSVKHVAAVDDLAEVVRVAKRVLPVETYDKLVAVLKAADARIASGPLFSEKGSDAPNGASTATEKLDQLVKQEVAKRNGKDTYAMVFADLTKSDPVAKALYTETQKEGR